MFGALQNRNCAQKISHESPHRRYHQNVYRPNRTTRYILSIMALNGLKKRGRPEVRHPTPGLAGDANLGDGSSKRMLVARHLVSSEI